MMEPPPVLYIREQDVSVCYTEAGVPERLGRGGQGLVLRALYLGREVALKVAGEYNKAVTPRQEREAEQELNILRQLQHRCVVRCIGATVWQGKLGILMELMSGGDLHAAIASDRVTWGAIALRIAIDVAEGLEYLHSLSPPIAHLDVKSYNCLIDRDCNAKLGDVGLSRFITGTHLTINSDLGPRCTFNWASPEQVQCKPLTCASDIFSFGVVLWELVTNGEKLDNRNRRRLRVPSEASQAVQDLIDDCTEYQAARRPDAATVLRRLQGLWTDQLTFGRGSATPNPPRSATPVGPGSFPLDLEYLPEPCRSPWDDSPPPSPRPEELETSTSETTVGSPVSMQGEAALQPSPSPVFGQLLTSILQRFRTGSTTPRTLSYEIKPHRLQPCLHPDGSRCRFGCAGDTTRETLDDDREVLVKRWDSDLFDGLGSEHAPRISQLHSCRHRNLVQLLGAHLQEDAYLVLEPMTRTLAQAQADPDLSSLLAWRERGSRIAADIASGLSHLHEQNIVDVNLTSSSIWLDDDYCAKLADAGTPLLLPPSASPGGSATHGARDLMDAAHLGSGVQCDIYKLGVVLWELVTQEQASGNDLRAPSQDECPEHVSKLIEACLNPHRYLRPTAKGCADFLASLPA